VLQAYLENTHQTIFENFDDLEREIHDKMRNKKGILRFGTGEFGDSLYLDHLSNFSTKISSLLEPYNAVVEFKTKSVNIVNLHKIKHPERVVIGFSLNTPAMIRLLEKNTASLDERFLAAEECVKMGFFVAFHFDPMFHYTNWEEEYRDVVKRIFDHVPAQKIAWVSMGGFRTMPSLKNVLKEQGDYRTLFSGEMINGEDGKIRYYRPLRVAMYAAIVDEFDAHAPDAALYLCMESPEVWEESGMKRRIPDGLVRYLDRRAQQMLGESKMK
jgi:spore photoproduct lyase